jgi:hypothetical protein
MQITFKNALSQFGARQIGDDVSKCRSAVVDCFIRAKPD